MASAAIPTSPAAIDMEAVENAKRDIVRDGTLAALYKRYYYDAYDLAPAAAQIK